MNSHSHKAAIGEIIKFPLDLLDDIIVAIKDFLPISANVVEALVGAAFGVLCLYQAHEIQEELREDYNFSDKLQLELMSKKPDDDNIYKNVLYVFKNEKSATHYYAYRDASGSIIQDQIKFDVDDSKNSYNYLLRKMIDLKSAQDDPKSVEYYSESEALAVRRALFSIKLANDRTLADEIEEVAARKERHRRMARNCFALPLTLGAGALGLSMLVGGTLAAVGLGSVVFLAGAHFYAFAIMATLTVTSGMSFVKTFSDVSDIKKRIEEYRGRDGYATDPNYQNLLKKRDTLETKLVYDGIDFAACGIIATALAIGAFGLFAGISVIGMGIPLLIIVAVATVAITAKVIEHRQTLFPFFYHDKKATTAKPPTPTITPPLEQNTKEEVPSTHKPG